MKLYDFSIIFLVVVFIVCVAGGVTSVYVFGPDNEVEKIAEKVIEKETGFDIDLTPSSKKATKSFFKSQRKSMMIA